jgi:hypothetical protein
LTVNEKLVSVRVPPLSVVKFITVVKVPAVSAFEWADPARVDVSTRANMRRNIVLIITRNSIGAL